MLFSLSAQQPWACSPSACARFSDVFGRPLVTWPNGRSAVQVWSCHQATQPWSCRNSIVHVVLTSAAAYSGVRSGRTKRRTRTKLDKEFSRQELPQLTEEELEQLRRGSLVQRQEHEGAVGWGFVVVDVVTPPEHILQILSAFEKYPHNIPVVRGAQVASSTRSPDGRVHARCTYYVSRFWLRVPVVHVFDYEAGILRFDLDRTVGQSIVRDVSGFWFVEPLPGDAKESKCSRGSRVWLRVGVSASPCVPGWLVNYASERALRRATSWLSAHRT